MTLAGVLARGISPFVRHYFVRHAQTQWNAEGRAQGHSDTPLSQHGLCQARQLCERILGWQPVSILSSDLTRARETVAGLVSAGWPIETDPRLRERNLGEWEGRSFAWIREETATRAAEWGASFETVRPEGGESLADFAARAEGVAQWIASLPSPTLIVSHRLLMSQVIGALLGGGAPRSFHFENTGVTELALHDEGFWQVLHHNDTAHLGFTVGSVAPR